MPLTATELARLPRDAGVFTLTLDAGGELLKCNQVVRAIPGKRLVCRGEWQGKDVFIKLYIGLEKLFNEELQGLEDLHAADIAAPAILHRDTADAGGIHVILLQPVQPAITLQEAWEAAANEAAHIKLLEKSVGTIAAHHQAGLEQRDIHLDNFLLSGERLFTLDGGGISSSPGGGLTVKQSRDNLALFFAQFYPEYDHLLDAVLPVYEQQRQFKAGTLSAKSLHKRVAYFRRRRQRKFLKKIFRDCSAFICSKGFFSYTVCDRELASPEMLKFLVDPDASLLQPDSEYLKQGNTCTLWKAHVGPHTLVVKRYNIKSFSHRIGRLFRTTRAAVSWKNAHQLEMHGILTPKPVALVERRLGPLRGKAWYVSLYAEGHDAQVLCDPAIKGSVVATAAASSIVALLNKLKHCRISHGDMKASNIILSEQGATVIDLDAMKQHRCEPEFRHAQQRDLHRLMRNWESCPDTALMFQQLLSNNNQEAGK